MSNLTAPAGPRTITVPGDGTNTLSVTLPPGVTLDVQAVLANIDASGAGDTLAELTIAEQAGVVIATKRQGEPIPAGDTGTATWALRLNDDGGGTAGTALETTDGAVTISPTVTLFILSGLSLTNFGGGVAGIGVPRVEWAAASVPGLGYTNPTGNIFAPTAVVPLQGAIGGGFNLSQAAVGKLIALRSGRYQVNVSGPAITSGAGNISQMRAITPHSSFDMASSGLLPGSIGPLAVIGGSALMRIDAGDALTFCIGNNTGAACRIEQNLSPEFQVFRVDTL